MDGRRIGRSTSGHDGNHARGGYARDADPAPVSPSRRPHVRSPRMRFATGFVLAASFVSVWHSPSALAQSRILAQASPTIRRAEDSFREVFVTAGFSAAFGAAVGAALLPFFPRQSLSNLRYVAGGASIGFIVGSGYAFYRMNAHALPATPAGEDPAAFEGDEAGYDDEGADEAGYSHAPDAPMPEGSLFVGDGGRMGLSVPAVVPIARGALVPMLDYRF